MSGGQEGGSPGPAAQRVQEPCLAPGHLSEAGKREGSRAFQGGGEPWENDSLSFGERALGRVEGNFFFWKGIF